MRNIAPRREKQFRKCCTGENIYGFVYMKYLYKNRYSSDITLQTMQQYNNIVSQLETGGICNLKKSKGLVSGFDKNTDFNVLINPKNYNEIQERCFGTLQNVEDLEKFYRLNLLNGYFYMLDSGLCWEINV